ncbi:MAG: hypothetical protein U0Z26_01880 [Anaerolineales bacterium]
MNKGDRGVENTEKALKSMLDLAHPTERIFIHHGSSMRTPASAQPAFSSSLWIPPIQRTVSTEGKGIPELIEAIARHVTYLRQSGGWAIRERARLEVELDALIRDALVNRFREHVSSREYENIVEQLIKRNMSPWEAVDILMNGRR